MASNIKWKCSCLCHNRYKWHDQDADAKEMWEAIKSRLGGNDESKKMQNYLLKQQFEGFSMSSLEGLHKGYDSFQTLLSQLEIHGAGVSHEDENQKFLSSPQLDFDDLKQINDDDLEEIDLKWQVAMISMRIKKFHKGTGRKLHFDTRDTVGFDETKVEFNCHKMNFAMMAYSSSNSGSDNEVQSCSKTYAGSYARLNDEQRDKLGDASVEIIAYTLALKKSVFINKECDLENTPVNDRYAKGMHAVPPLMTGNYMPSGLDVEIDYSKFTYGPKQTSANKSDYKSIDNACSDSDSSVETTTSMPAPIEDAPKVVSEPKVENVKEPGTPNHCPKIEKQDRHSHIRKGLGYARNSCFVCGSFSHLIRDCDFHEKRMAKQAALIKSKEKGTGQQAYRPVWSNVQRVNHQNQFVPSTVLTKTSKIPVNAAKQNFSRQTALTSTASKVNTARPFVNETKPKDSFISLIHLIKVSAVKGNGVTTIKASAGCNMRNKRNTWNKVFKYNSGSHIRKDDPHQALKDKGIVDSGFSKHMTRNKAHLADYQEFVVPEIWIYYLE
uniref:Ribonuclease H-like domain-containing protein n=1 Tax=Tanacetum cinerariifolium TaxID=118510 RepID=A0A6L2JUY0_TANCI|nr:ribonuclease H-like domain-containing protein [Tanacetum cinerariifolium]